MYGINKMMPAEKKTVVFNSTHLPYVPDSISTTFVDFLTYVPTTSYCNLNGERVEWYSNPTTEIVLEQMASGNNQNIILIGNDDGLERRLTDNLLTDNQDSRD
ncbi:MAG: hypothetical protein HY363_06505 [Candidatus Aenigmarchaeota archaeon]|nr:hypothetical protein [Candidatus Aenigmarchaeota archaeon]